MKLLKDPKNSLEKYLEKLDNPSYRFSRDKENFVLPEVNRNRFLGNQAILYNYNYNYNLTCENLTYKSDHLTYEHPFSAKDSTYPRPSTTGDYPCLGSTLWFPTDILERPYPYPEGIKEFKIEKIDKKKVIEIDIDKLLKSLKGLEVV